ncbi:MAG: type II toxin-antitoxin system PemK/MazF family toxin, partial [Thermoanaerobaculia bacterium]|nr:type II toxin-antitoxin system PemK/MazF family toxin [Thermoanaerobaculia bacterium]
MIERGDIFFVDLDPALGRERRGRRPVLIASSSALNRQPLVVVVVVAGRDAASFPRDSPTNHQSDGGRGFTYVDVQRDGKSFRIRSRTSGCAGKVFQAVGVAVPRAIQQSGEPGRSANVPMPACNLLNYSRFHFLGVEDEFDIRLPLRARRRVV